VRQYLERNVLGERVDGNHHIRSFRCRWGRSIQTFRERFEAERLEHDSVDAHPELSATKLVEGVPRPGILGHELVHGNVIVVGPERSVVGVYVDNVADYPTGIQHVEGIAEGVGGRPVTAARVGHEDLNSADII